MSTMNTKCRNGYVYVYEIRNDLKDAINSKLRNLSHYVFEQLHESPDCYCRATDEQLNSDT